MKEAYPDAVPPTKIWRWYSDFEKGWESGELKLREKSVYGNININLVTAIIEDERHVSI